MTHTIICLFVCLFIYSLYSQSFIHKLNNTVNVGLTQLKEWATGHGSNTAPSLLQPKLTYHSVKEKIIFRNRLNQESPLSSLPLIVVVKEVFSVLMLCAPVFIFTSSSSALLGRPRCGLSI